MTISNSLPPSLACPDLIGWRGRRPILLGSRCTACGERYFPATSGCTRCCGRDLQPCELGHDGSLWSWTVQAFCPKPPYDAVASEADFRPYGVGYVELACGVKVESRLSVADPAQLRIGMPMTLVLEPYRHGPDGSVHTYAFAPAESAS